MHPHECICGELTEELGVLGLSCRKSSGRHFRHSAVNDLIKRSLASAEIPSRLEPTGIVRNNTGDNTDNKRPDGFTIAPLAIWTLSSLGYHVPGYFGSQPFESCGVRPGYGRL